MDEEVKMIRREIKMERRKLPPILKIEWSGVFENYARKWVARHHWRVAATIGDQEDAMQEAALIFVRCRNHYQYKVDNPAWFMSLYKRALVNDWNTMSVKDGRLRNTLPSPDVDILDHNYGELIVQLREASDELKTLLKIVAEAPQEFLEILFDGTCEIMLARRLRRWCRISGAGDVVSELRQLLT